MQIAPSEFVTELSYLDLCNAIFDDVVSDVAMPRSIKDSVLQKLASVQMLLEPYSA